jgi:hypothetical protein
MNCRPGDLAIIVKSMAGNEGKIVRCVRLATREEAMSARFGKYPIVWVLEAPLRTKLGFISALSYDNSLRPIRDSGEDARDETLQWLPVPNREKEEA